MPNATSGLAQFRSTRLGCLLSLRALHNVGSLGSRVARAQDRLCAAMQHSSHCLLASRDHLAKHSQLTASRVLFFQCHFKAYPPEPPFPLRTPVTPDHKQKQPSYRNVSLLSCCSLRMECLGDKYSCLVQILLMQALLTLAFTVCKAACQTTF